MYRRVSLILIILFCVVATSRNLKRQKRIVGGKPAAQPPVDDPVVYVTRNNRQAQIYGSRDPNKGFYVFRGIRFGQPPVGQYRFQRPIPVHLEGVINATKWGPPCPQPNNTRDGEVVGSEDCLFLNVFTPMLSEPGDGYPVLIWIHGGGFRRGSACQYEMRNIIKKKVVVVSIQYRLGSLGFLSTGTKELPGNNGIFDMMLAVKWVEDYIEYFGGNPKKIVAFGHGTGASSAFILTLSQLSRNAFSGLIAMSGTILSHFGIDKNPLNTAEYIASKNGCPLNDTIEMVRCLRQIPVKELIAADSNLESIRRGVGDFITSLATLLGPGPVIEGSNDERSLPNFVTDTPEDSLKIENIPTVPLLTGVMNNEVGGALLGDYRSEVHNKLRTSPNFLYEKLIPKLQSTIPNFGNKSQFLPKAFDSYLNVFQKKGSSISISKIAEAMGDSLFNVPAFLTVDHWSKKTKAFLYSFDYKGKRNYGKNFLSGSPIADAKHNADGITSHGDDLGYIFGQNTITGEALRNLDEPNEEDEFVEDVFTTMIAEFARNGEPSLATASQSGSLLSNITPVFTSEANPFISISSNPQVLTKFRYCEMALWTGLTERLQSAACSLFKTTLDTIDNRAQKTINTVESSVKTLENVTADLIPGLSLVKSRMRNVNVKGFSGRTNQKTVNNVLSPNSFPLGGL
ncbi:carboxylesterase 1E [Calliopsis andreniformis]|uniref:carboxylesterase 1E n=1 Tax=Calliopsis andreniformis TaxID=337506 RepID=UPI003FCC901E